jgi:hypothetical protein
VVAALSFTWFHVDNWLGLKALGHHDARLVFCGLAVSLLANIPGSQLIVVFTATGQFAKYQWLYNAYALFACLVTATALSLGARPATLAAIAAARASIRAFTTPTGAPPARSPRPPVSLGSR